MVHTCLKSPVIKRERLLEIIPCNTWNCVPKILNNSNVIVTYMRTERAWLPTRTASCLLRGKAHTASHPWTCPAPVLRRWRAEPPFCRERWLWSTAVFPGLWHLRGHTQSLTPQPCKKWLSSAGLACWETAFVRVTFKNKTLVTDEKWLPLWLHLL